MTENSKLIFEGTTTSEFLQEIGLLIDKAIKSGRTEEKKPILQTVEEASQHLKVCPQTIRNLYKKNTIKNYRIGRRVLVDKTELEEKFFIARK